MRIIIIIIGFTCFLTACKKEIKGIENPQSIPVIASKPLIRDIPFYIESIGTLFPNVCVEIHPEVSGILTEVFVKEGQWIEKNAPLFKIDPTSYLIKLQETQAQLALDKIKWEAAQKKLERFRSLAEKDLIAQVEWDTLLAEALVAKSTLQADEAKILSAKLDVERCTISAPCAGRLGKLNVHTGNYIKDTNNPNLACIMQLNPLVVEFALTENELIHQPKMIEIQSLISKEKKAQGAITYFDNQFDSKTGLLLVKGSIPNSSHEWLPGQNVRVRMQISTFPNALLVPQRAVKHNHEGPFVYVIQENNKVELRQVKTGEDVDQDVIILEGINPEEKIVTEGHLRLSHGSKVEVHP